MTNYIVRISPEATNDLRASYLWGVENWGEENARAWLSEIETGIFKKLSTAPLAFPIAPESREFDLEIRQFVFGRYRVLFLIKMTSVLVLRVRGPFTGRFD